MQTEPPFAPIPAALITPSYQDELQQTIERGRQSRQNLALLNDTSFNSWLPYCWGYTIYRVRFEGDSDKRFVKGLDKLNTWLRYAIRGSRYRDGEGSAWLNPDFTPSPYDSTDELAKRMYNEIIQDYPDADEITTEPEGEEDFTPIGEAFSRWVASLNINLQLSRHNPRYNQCLIIDKAALESLERLPDTLPSIELRNPSHPDRAEVTPVLHNAWLWILDRETAEADRQGQEEEFPPWLRLRLSLFQSHWFWMVNQNYIYYKDWQRSAEEDTQKWETVLWWNPHGSSFNRTKREIREASAKADMPDAV
jgi:hypothetical protein